VVAQNGQSIEIGNACHTRQRIKTKQIQQQKTTQCALDTIIHKQTQITLIRHEPSYNQLEVKNEPTIVCIRKSQHGTQNVMTYNRRTQNITKDEQHDLNDRYLFCNYTTPMGSKSVY
jgi:hypothetical protein